MVKDVLADELTSSFDVVVSEANAAKSLYAPIKLTGIDTIVVHAASTSATLKGDVAAAARVGARSQNEVHVTDSERL